MTTYSRTPSFSSRPQTRWGRFALWIMTIVVVGTGAILITRINGMTVSVNNGNPLHATDTPRPDQPKIVDDPEYQMPEKDGTRLDILVLGIRGKDDIENGGLLSDTILLFSMDKKTGVAAITSIPRDLTVRVTDGRTEKINTAYIYNGLAGSKRLYSRILGVRIDNIIVLDFNSFKSIVDSLGGVTVTLDQPFHEAQQWGYEFSLPAGENTLDGDQALYYVRSRYGTSDFDRSRRQMQVVMAIKNKITALNLTQDPLKALSVVTTTRKHIETDLDIFDLGTIKDLATQGSQLAKIKRYQLTTDNVLYETKVNGIYELLPRDNTLAHIKTFFQTVLTASPNLPTPAQPSPRTPTL